MYGWSAVRGKINKIMLFSLVLAVMAAFSSNSAAAAEFVVHSGESIQDAVSNAKPGDSIIVEPGIYKEQISISTNSLSISSQSNNPADTVIEGPGFAVWAANITIKGFTLKGNNSDSGISIVSREGKCRIEKNEILNYVSGIDLPLGSAFNFIDSNTISNCQSGITVSEGYKSTVSSNVISGCQNGITFREGSENVIQNNKISICQSGITYMEGFENTVNNNEISKCVDGINLGNGDAASTEIGTHVENNIITSNDVGISVGGIEGGYVIAGNTISFNKNGFEDYTTGGNLIYNNYFKNTVNVNLQRNLGAKNTWNISGTAGKNIIGGSFIAGNYWAAPAGGGFSQAHFDTDGDGISQEPYSLNGINIDYLPLALPSQKPVPVLPEANFSANSTQGPAPLSVQFTDLSKNAVSWNWDFNNNGKSDSSDKDPVCTYLSPGNYTVNLTVKNENGTASKTATIIVTAGDINNPENNPEENKSLDDYNGSTNNSDLDGGSSEGHSHRNGGSIIASGSTEPASSSGIKEISETKVEDTANEMKSGINSGNKTKNESDILNKVPEKVPETKQKQHTGIPGFEIGCGVLSLLCSFLYRKK